MRSLVIVGSGGNAYDVIDVIEALNACGRSWRIAGFLDDARPCGSNHLGLPVLGSIEDALRYEDHRFVNVIGSDRSYRLRPQILSRAALTPERMATLVHPSASVSQHAHLGRGVVVNYGASVGGGVVIGDDVLLGPGCIIGHNTVIEDHSVIGPGAVVSGFVRVGRTCYIGAGAKVRQQQEIGAAALVGIGAVVVRDVAPGAVVVGNPARPIVRSSAPPPRDFEPLTTAVIDFQSQAQQGPST
jgi:sugar O-acyltransferase (sialic acid O-acetyltransferase NeuD family)